MSFILDALKKSERARQRQAGPSLFEVKIAAPRRTLPAWAVILGVLLVINAAVVGWMMLGHPARRAAPAASPSAADSSPQGHPGRAPLSGRSPPYGAPTAPDAAANAPALPTMNTAAANSASRSHTARTPAGSPPSQLPATASDAAASDYAPAVEPSARAQADASLPLYREVDSAPGKSLPSLHLDLHVYAADPDKRFVMINMHKLKQGDALPDGVQVVSIRPDGVVLSYEGRRFLLPR